MSTVELPNALPALSGQITGMQKLPEILARIDQRLQALNLNDSSASKRAGKPDAIRNIRRALNSPNRQGVTLETLNALAVALDTTVAWLADGTEQPEAPSSGYRVEPNAVFEPGPISLPPIDGPRDVQELGITVGGFGDDDDAFELNGQVIDYVKRPFGILHRKDVFALRVSSDSMAPRYEDGDRVFVEPRKPSIRDYVVIELKPLEDGRAGKSFIKRLVSMNSQLVTVEQFNPAGRLEFETREIKRLLRVIPEKELRGE